MASARPPAAVVADASVIVKWFATEAFGEQSVRMKRAHVDLETKIVVPTLARYEVLNALKYSGKFGTRELGAISKDLENIRFLEIPPDWESVANLSFDYGLTVYDSSYVAIGKERGLMVFTADEKMLEKVEDLKFVQHIREYGKVSY